MSMGLVQNGMLWGLLALAIPFIIHLLFRQKPREVQIGSVCFLREIMEKHRNRRRVMKWLLLSIRMLGITLLVLLFARPYLSERADGLRGRKLVVILIDRSASMQLRADGVRLIDSAVETARKLIRQATNATEFEVAWFDHEVHPIQLGNHRRDTQTSLLQVIEAPTLSFSATDYAAAFRWAHDICTTSKAETVELHMLTDLQQSGLAWSEVEPMPAGVAVEVHDLGRELPNNVAIVASTPKRMVVRPGESTSIESSLINAGPFSLDELPISLNLHNGNRKIHKRRKLKLESDSVESVSFELPDLAAGLWQGTVAIESLDDMAFDNVRHVAIMSAPQYSVLVLDGAPNEVDVFTGTHHLRAALRLAPSGATYADSPYVPTTTGSDRLLSAFDVVVLSNYHRFRGNDITQMKNYVESGGNLLVFTGFQVRAESYREMSDAGLVPGEIAGPRETYDLPWRVGSWDDSHSILTPFLDAQYGDLSKLSFRGITEMRADDSEHVRVVASFSDGKPFIVEKQFGTDNGGNRALGEHRMRQPMEQVDGERTLCTTPASDAWPSYGFERRRAGAGGID